MTAKRFIIDEYLEIGSVVMDTENENVRFKNEKQCCDLLNELYEENQKLKKENAELEKFRYSIFKRMGELYEKQ